MIKLAANAFLMTRISFINEIANVCEATGADVVKVAEGVGLDHRLGPHFLRAGIGYGGSLFPERLARAEAARVELRLPLPAPLGRDRGQRAAEAARDREARRRTWARSPGKRVALLGLAFKPNTDDMREAPSIVLACAAARRGRGGARLGSGRRRGRAAGRRSRSSRSVLEAVRGADAAVIVTEWPELQELARDEVRAAMANPLIVDGRNLLDPAAVRAAGLRVRGHRPAGVADPAGRRARASSRPSSSGSAGGGDRPRGRQGRAARRRRRRPAEVARRRRRAAARRLPGRRGSRGRASSA